VRGAASSGCPGSRPSREGLRVELQRELRREDEVDAQGDRPLGLVEAAEDVAAAVGRGGGRVGDGGQVLRDRVRLEERGCRRQREGRPGPEVEVAAYVRLRPPNSRFESAAVALAQKRRRASVVATRLRFWMPGRIVVAPAGQLVVPGVPGLAEGEVDLQ